MGYILYTMGEKELLIFDFDGTIADTKSVYYKVIYEGVKKFGYSYQDVDKIVDLGLSLKNVLKKLGLSSLSLWFLHKKIMKNVKKQADKVKKCKDVDAIKELEDEKILVTNSLKEFVLPILKHFRLQKEFKEIYGAEDFTDKAEFIESYLRKNKIKKENCYYIGDRAADVKTAKKVGCRSIIICGKCAWDSRKEILEEKPDFVLEDIKDLRKILNNI